MFASIIVFSTGVVFFVFFIAVEGMFLAVLDSLMHLFCSISVEEGGSTSFPVANEGRSLSLKSMQCCHSKPGRPIGG